MALARFDDVAGIGPLIEALEIPDPAVQRALSASLPRLLPRLRASDSHLLNPMHRRLLRALLLHSPNTKNYAERRPIIIAALRCLEQVGDESFLETVESIAHRQTDDPDEEVKTAAERCLPFLKQRIENERLSHDLLRAASAGPATDPDILLRPIDSAGRTEPDELLRPTLQQ